MYYKRGFTLVEIAIVLAVIGLLVGGVVAAKTLFRSSETVAVISELETIQSALKAFKEKYKALPGDMPNATSYWPQVSSGCTSQAGPKGQTCNGDGNERINEHWDGQEHEVFRAWQHLELAGLYPGDFSGVRGPNTVYEMVPGVNVPKSTVSFGVYALHYWSNIKGSNSYTQAAPFNNLNYDPDCGNCITLGAYSGGQNTAPIMSPNEALALDKKIDDGRAGSGNITPGKPSYNPGCATTDTPETAEYAASDEMLCALFVKTGF
jgi:prepilin-type N-terminal cleavage/methylation domain-containing protein